VQSGSIGLGHLTRWPESASELYRPSDRSLSAKLLPTFADRGCHVVSVTDPYGRILGFLDRLVLGTIHNIQGFNAEGKSVPYILKIFCQSAGTATCYRLDGPGLVSNNARFFSSP
jgi:hypothetical protein